MTVIGTNFTNILNNHLLFSSEPNIYRYKHYKAHGYAIINTNSILLW